MAKTFKTTNTTYHITAKYLNRKTFTLDDIEFDIDSKNKRIIGKYVIEHYADCKNATDIMIDNITAITTTTNVTIHASLDDIIKACEAANITVTYNDADSDDNDSDDNDADSDNNDSDDTATEDSNN